MNSFSVSGRRPGSLLKLAVSLGVVLLALIMGYKASIYWPILLVVGIGAAIVLRRPILARSHEGERIMPATAMLLFVLAAIALPPLAAQARLGVLSLAGGNIAVPSQKLLDLGAAGLIKACGFPDGKI